MSGLCSLGAEHGRVAARCPPPSIAWSSRMPTQTDTTSLNFRDSMPVGSDFVGGAEVLPVRPAPPGHIVPGSDFAGGAVSLSTEDNHRAPSEERVA
jgi:hypothetical protein